MRFPGFEGEWENRRLGEMVDFKAGYAFKSDKMRSEKDRYQLIKMSNVYNNELRLDRNPSYWSEVSNKEEEFILKKGDTVLTLTGTVGKKDFGYSIMIKEDNKYLLNQRLVLLRERKEKSYCGFINQIITNEKFLFHFFGEAKGGTGNQANVGTEDIKNIRLNFPKLLEQIKIADFLTLLENRITTQSKIIKQLETLIKGLSEKLLSQKIRFKEFKDEWELKSLGELCEKAKSGGTPKSTVKEYYDGSIPFLSISDITEQGKYLYSTERTISKKGLENSTSWIVPINSIIYSMYASVGFVSINKIELATSQAVLNLMPKSNIYTEYLYYYLVYFQKFVNKYVTTGTQGNLNAETVKNFETSLPTLKEQIKIAEFLTVIDNKIQIEKDRLDKYRSQKKHFLQNLFI